MEQLAQKYLDQLQTKERDNGDTFLCFKGETPDWVQDAHDGMLPNDFSYEFISDALGILAEIGEDEDYYERVDQTTDQVNCVLLNWVGSNYSRIGFVDEALADGAMTLSGALYDGQAKERLEVFQVVRDALMTEIDVLDD